MSVCPKYPPTKVNHFYLTDCEFETMLEAAERVMVTDAPDVELLERVLSTPFGYEVPEHFYLLSINSSRSIFQIVVCFRYHARFVRHIYEYVKVVLR